jgi:hypothetical protein
MNIHIRDVKDLTPDAQKDGIHDVIFHKWEIMDTLDMLRDQTVNDLYLWVDTSDFELVTFVREAIRAFRTREIYRELKKA